MCQLRIRTQLKLNKSDPGSKLNKEFEQVTGGINSLVIESNDQGPKPHQTIDGLHESGSNDEIISHDILKNSQAFLRITELARKVGALNCDEEYSVDKLTGRIKSTNRDSSSSGVSSASSVMNGENLSKSYSKNGNLDQLDKSENGSFEGVVGEQASSFSSAVSDGSTKNLNIDEEVR